MARYVTDPETGIRTKVSGTNYIPPCVVKTASRKAAKSEPEPVAQTVTETDETGNAEAD